MAVIMVDWPAPANVIAYYTTKSGGCSLSGYGSFNLASHVGDEPSAVQRNREILAQSLNSLAQSKLAYQWLNQVHGVEVAKLSKAIDSALTADGVTTKSIYQVCTVLTADCLPILICDRTGSQVAAVHAGWRGLAAGIVTNAVSNFHSPAKDLLCYLGPAISQDAFQVGKEVKLAFARAQKQRAFSSETDVAFKLDERSSVENDQKKYFADLYALARLELMGLGVKQIYGGDNCTFSESDLFYSYRRNAKTGRMASGICLVE